VRIGLRGRLVAALALISALTLAVAALALLPALNQRLRENTLTVLAQAVDGERTTLEQLPPSALKTGDPRLVQLVRSLRQRTAAAIAVLGPDGTVLASTDADPTEVYAAARRALQTGREQKAVSGDGAAADAEVAAPVQVGGQRVVLAARRPLNDLHDATVAVTNAFTVAAAAGLGGALLVGLLLAGRLARRIRRLRETALRVAEVGPMAEIHPDAGRDEVADLSRAFVTMQHRLLEQEQARRSFVATASHELRTPLSSLLVMLDLLVEDLRAQPVALEDARLQAQRADEQVVRLSSLAADLLDLSRIDAAVPLREEPVDVAAIVRSVAAELRDRPEAVNRRLELSLDSAPWAVGDPSSVAQIVRNLLDNALRHTPDVGAVRVHVELRDGLVSVAVEDDGPGVPDHEREQIFERFARGAHAAGGGFGLGLAIGRELARRMGGDLELADTSTGARFVLRLPAAPAS
jgi:signal transduction histidine kinase